MPDLQLEQHLLAQGYSWIAGVDEAGRGPLAGPVVSGAVILPPGCDPGAPWLAHINDSKVLSPKQREKALKLIEEHAVALAVGTASSQEIDQVGIAEATRLSMARAVSGLPQPPQHLLIDYIALPALPLPYKAMVHGDSLSCSIAAASIVAKVTRDRMMQQADTQYPLYGFARHKGYGTPAHLRMLALHGPSSIHRLSFAPLKDMPSASLVPR